MFISSKIAVLAWSFALQAETVLLESDQPKDDDDSSSSSDGGFDYGAAEKEINKPDKQNENANLSELIAKVEKIVENAQNLNLFATPLGLVVTGILSIVVGIFGFYAMYCQFFEVSAFDMDMSILFSDVEQSTYFLQNPDLITPCFDTFEASCVGPWVYAIWFGILGAYLILNGLLRVLLNVGPAWSRKQVGTQPTMLPSSLQGAMKLPFQIDLQDFSPGGKYFWHNGILLLSIDVIFQILRFCVVEDSYATTNASVAMVHMITMILHVDACVLMYVADSRFGFITVGMFANMAYLAIRMFGSEGCLGMRSSCFLDFMTTAVPFFLCLMAFRTLAKPILRRKDPRSVRKSKRYKVTDDRNSEDIKSKKTSLVDSLRSFVRSARRHRGTLVAAFCGLGVTIAGLVAVSTIIDKWQNDECPSPLDPDTFLPVGFQCVEWQFNMLLSNPACSCKYLYVDVWGCDEQDYNVTTFDDYLNPLVDHVEDTKFLAVNYNSDCQDNDGDGAKSAHSKFIASSLKDLEMVSFHGDLGFEILQHNDWSGLSDLKGIHLFAPHLKQIDSKTINSWSKLQVFGCSPCPLLNTVNLFSDASDKLPRLRSVNLEGVSSCPDDKFGLHGLSSYRCTNRTEPANECNHISKWFLDHLENQMKKTIATECQEPSCSVFLDAFASVDGNVSAAKDPDALLDKDEFGAYLQRAGFPTIENITAIDVFSCMISTLRKQVPFDQTLDEDLEPSDGMTLHEFLASQTGVSNCASCDRTQKFNTAGAVVFEQQKYPEVCKSIDYVVDPVQFKDACIFIRSTCGPECDAYSRYNNIFDEDHDGFLNETEYINARSALYENLPIGQLHCFLTLGGSDCVDDSDGLTNLKMQLNKVVSIGMWQDGVEVSSCANCFDQDNIDDHAEIAVQDNADSCQDNIEFRDAKGKECADWQRADCSDLFRDGLLADYTIFDLHQVQSNCRYSCGFCEPKINEYEYDYERICQDNDEFRDFRNNACADWHGLNCRDWEYWFGTYTFFELLQVELNCPVSCGFCQPTEDRAEATCQDNLHFYNSFAHICKVWEGLDCSVWWKHMTTQHGLHSDAYYTHLQLRQVQLNCPEACGICQPEECDDTPGFRDGQGAGCGSWRTFDCLNDEFASSEWGYTSVDMMAVRENCLLSCGLCAAEDVDERICVDDEQKCSYLNDGHCDDGGEGSVYHSCPYGSDCIDCGPRYDHCNDYAHEDGDGCSDVHGCSSLGQACYKYLNKNCSDDEFWQTTYGWGLETVFRLRQDCPYTCGLCDQVDQPTGYTDKRKILCNNDCSHSRDGQCDDGGEGSGSVSCAYGNDCDDCGVRYEDGCFDVAGYTDLHGHPCSAYQGFDCLDYELWQGFGFSAADLMESQKNCKFTCDLCDYEFPNDHEPTDYDDQDENEYRCVDVPGFADAIGDSCSTWIGYDCLADQYDEWWFYQGFSLEESVTIMAEIAENCPWSCILCDSDHDNGATDDFDEAEDSSSVTGCVDLPGYTDAIGDSCSSWTGYNCLLDQHDEWWIYEGFSLEDSVNIMADIAENCPYSCNLCDSDQDNGAADNPTDYPTSHPTAGGSELESCADVPEYLDATGLPCFAWMGRDCTDVELWANYGFTNEDMIEIAGNCSESCGLCN